MSFRSLLRVRSWFKLTKTGASFGIEFCFPTGTAINPGGLNSGSHTCHGVIQEPDSVKKLVRTYENWRGGLVSSLYEDTHVATMRSLYREEAWPLIHEHRAEYSCLIRNTAPLVRR